MIPWFKQSITVREARRWNACGSLRVVQEVVRHLRGVPLGDDEPVMMTFIARVLGGGGVEWCVCRLGYDSASVAADGVRKPVDLQGAGLRGADLREADLRGADLRGAVLRDAVLRGADLRGADLCRADLRCADLRGADLWDAFLKDADLRDTDLRGAVLADTYMMGADLTGARMPEGWEA